MASTYVERYAHILEHAERVFGSREKAERWMTKPALGLDGRCPADLLANADDLELLEVFLTRIEYGVYH